MPSSHRQKPKAKASARPAAASKKSVKKPAPKKPAARPSSSSAKSGRSSKAAPKPKPEPEVVVVPRPTGRVHVLSLSFVRDGDEFMARMETDGGQITELKNRSLDQLLTLVASELEDLLE
jgi:hypothetical protein